MKPADLATWIEPSDPAISPDGTQVAFVVTTVDLEANTYRSRVWLAPIDGSWAPRPLTDGEHRDAKPRWSPDGSMLAFVSHRDEPGSELYVLPLAGGEPRRLASWPEECEEAVWSPRGDRLAVLLRERDEDQYAPEHDRDRPPRRIDRLEFRLDSVGFTSDRRKHVWTVAVDDGAVVRVTNGDFHHNRPAWFDDETIVCGAGRTPTWDVDDAVDLYAFAANGKGRPKRLTKCGGTHGLPAVSATGVLAYAHGDGRVVPTHPQVAIDERDLTASLDRACVGALPLRWDGDTILFVADEHGAVPLLRVDAGTSEITTVIGGDRRVTGFTVAAAVVAATVQEPDGFTQVVVVDAAGERTLTSYEVPFEVSRPERFTVGEIDAWLVRPIGAGDGPHPTLLNIHGGPFTQYGSHLFDEFQVYAAAGYAVVYCNPRGSSGSSQDWGRAIRGVGAEIDPGSGWGGVDADDILAVVDDAIGRFPGVIDADRMGVIGGSYGGYMTAWLIGHTDRFVAACAERALTNMVTFCHTSDIGAGFPSCYVGVNHLEDPGEYVRQSPVTYDDKITTPLLLLHSERDLRCPIEQAEDLYTRLKLRGRDVELVRFPGEGHELSRSGAPKHRLQRFEIILEFFKPHLHG